MGKHLSILSHQSAEGLSAFFVGLLYFLAQWMWQMVNAKAGAGLPVAYVLFLATAASGTFSFHALLMHGVWPPLRMRIVNGLLFTPFLLIGAFSYERARVGMMDIDPNFLGSRWYEHQAFVLISGFCLGCVPFVLSLVINRLRTPHAVDQPNREP